MASTQPTSQDLLGDERTWLQQRFDRDEFDFKAMAGALWRRKWSLATLVAMAMILASLYVDTLTPIYQASSRLMFEQQQTRLVGIQGVFAGDQSTQEYIQNQVTLLNSRELAERVVRELNLHEHWEFDPAQAEPPLLDWRRWLALGWEQVDPRRWMGEPADDAGAADAGPRPLSEAERFSAAVSQLRARTAISQVRGSSMVDIRVQMADRFTAAEVANRMAEGFIDAEMEARMQTSLGAIDWLQTRLEDSRERLRQAETELQSFREQADLVDVGGIRTLGIEELTSTNARLRSARQARADTQRIYEQIQAMQGSPWERIAALPAVQREESVRRLREVVGDAQAELDVLAQRYGPRHPEMLAASGRLAAAQARLQEGVERLIETIEVRFETAVAEEQQLARQFEVNRDEVQELTWQEFRLRELQREVDTQASLYQTFLTRLQEATATLDIERVRSRVVGQAAIPSTPVSPNKDRMVVSAAAAAGIGGGLLVLLLAFMNNTFRGTDEVEEKLNLPVLGVVPELPRRLRSDMVRMYSDAHERRFAEAIRTIRTGLLLTGVDRPQRIVLVSSSIPGEGKTTLAANLAAAFAQTNTTLLLEADMRRPSLGKALGFQPGRPGLANVIMGTARVEDAISDIGGLAVMTAGLVPPNPLELLLSPEFRDLIDILTGRYERIVIDSPPVQAVSDSLVLAQFSDVVVHVVQAEQTHRNVVQRAIGQLLQRGAPLGGVVLSRVNVSRAMRQGYSYGGYYDYYGYSRESAGTAPYGRRPEEGLPVTGGAAVGGTADAEVAGTGPADARRRRRAVLPRRGTPAP
jgi:polysaccharide biosynthesis transport protein